MSDITAEISDENRLKDPIHLLPWIQTFGVAAIVVLTIESLHGVVIYLAQRREGFDAPLLDIAMYIAWMQILLMALSIIMFGFASKLTYRLMRNVNILHPDEKRISPGWAAASYFVPIIFWIFPFQALLQIWSGTFGMGPIAKYKSRIIFLSWGFILAVFIVGFVQWYIPQLNILTRDYSNYYNSAYPVIFAVLIGIRSISWAIGLYFLLETYKVLTKAHHMLALKQEAQPTSA